MTWEQVGASLNCSSDAARSKARRYKCVDMRNDKSIEQRMAIKVAHGKVADQHGISEGELRAILQSAKGKPAPRRKAKMPQASSSVKMLVISDTHIGHEKFHTPLFEAAAKDSKDCDLVLHPGDHLEGMSGRPGHIYELTEVGYAAQINRCRELYALIDVPMYGIDGNHDQWFKQKNNAGVIVGEELDETISNYTHLGEWEGDLDLNGLKIKLFHAGDGSAYAHCFDDTTEILTENGWKLFAQLERGERVATLSQDGRRAFEWQKPTDYIEQHYEGNMLYFQSRCFDQMVTPNHRMYCRLNPAFDGRKEELSMPQKSHRRNEYGEWGFKEAHELIDGHRQKWQFSSSCDTWDGNIYDEINIPYRESKNSGVNVKHFGSIHPDYAAELIGWYVTEGYIRKSQLNISQCEVANPSNHDQIVRLFERLGLEPKYNGRNNKDIRIGSMELCEWLVDQCGSGSKDKFLPKWLKDSDDYHLRLLFDTMIKGDGWETASGYGYKSISHRLLEDFAEIAIKLGYGVTFSTSDTVLVRKVQTCPSTTKPPQVVEYDGMIYCVSVPNTCILIRRNGKVSWSGNSYKMQKLIESFSGGEKPHIVFSGHYHKSIYQFSRNVHGFECGTICGQSRFMRGKKLQAHMGYWIVTAHYGNQGVARLQMEFVPWYE